MQFHFSIAFAMYESFLAFKYNDENFREM